MPLTSPSGLSGGAALATNGTAGAVVSNTDCILPLTTRARYRRSSAAMEGSDPFATAVEGAAGASGRDDLLSSCSLRNSGEEASLELPAREEAQLPKRSSNDPARSGESDRFDGLMIPAGELLAPKSWAG